MDLVGDSFEEIGRDLTIGIEEKKVGASGNFCSEVSLMTNMTNRGDNLFE